MSPRITRLEFSIVAVALIVLLFCSKPPKPGTASVSGPETPISIANATSEAETVQPQPEVSLQDQTELTETYQEPTPGQATAQEPDVSTTSWPVQNDLAISQTVAPQTPVTTAQDPGAESGKAVNGQITVRWVWDGNKHVPQKVRIVQEPNGVISVWSLDD